MRSPMSPRVFSGCTLLGRYDSSQAVTPACVAPIVWWGGCCIPWHVIRSYPVVRTKLRKLASIIRQAASDEVVMTFQLAGAQYSRSTSPPVPPTLQLLRDRLHRKGQLRDEGLPEVRVLFCLFGKVRFDEENTVLRPVAKKIMSSIRRWQGLLAFQPDQVLGFSRKTMMTSSAFFQSTNITNTQRFHLPRVPQYHPGS